MQNSKASVTNLLLQAAESGASDLHLTVGSAPFVRLAGQLKPLDFPVLKDGECRDLIFSLMTERQRNRFEEELDLDFGFAVEGISRFRANVFMQRSRVAAVFRVIPLQIFDLEELGLPPVVAELADKRRGLVLVTGPSGSGKSTTLASMIERINKERRGHIITVEDPIEFLHSSKGCLVSQREVKTDVRSFSQALRMVIREDPDIVLIGELRDLETVTSALRIAETGHLTLATLHTNSAQSTINRVIGMFPPHQHDQVRRQLSSVLEGIVSQLLLPEAGGDGCIVATEVLIPTLGIRNLIRDKKEHQIYSLMQMGQKRFGMHTMNQSLARLLSQDRINYESAVIESPDLFELKEILGVKGTTMIDSAGNQRVVDDYRITLEHAPRNEEQTGCLFTDLRDETLKKGSSFQVKSTQNQRTL